MRQSKTDLRKAGHNEMTVTYFNSLKTHVPDPNTDGYGRAARNIIELMRELEWEEENNEEQLYYFLFSTPPAIRSRATQLKSQNRDCKLIGFTMWETSRLPKGWKEGLDMLDLLLTPSEFCKDMFKNNGVKVPIEVMPIPLAIQDFPFVERDIKRSPFVFVQYANLTKRKGWHFTVDAFTQEFAFGEPVRLIFKSKVGVPLSFTDERISLICGPWTPKQMTDLLHRAAVF